MFKSVVYQGNSLLGEAEIYPQNQKIDMMNKEIRIAHFSQPSERCPPLAVLHTIAPCGICLKMESKALSGDSPLLSLHTSCFRENKTAVMPLGEEELHLVAMSSKNKDEQYSCFWGFKVAPGLYNSCLVMLNLRCLGIVFDLDETLIVANTMRSFEDRIDALQRKINTEVDPQRISGMLAEVKRYQDDKIILKQYAENDQVIDNGKVIKVQSEVVPALSDNHPSIVRPLIRLQDKNIILTRINPVIRDTSVLVRLRPAWEDLRSYLTARGRKRFEVYVCTMAERDYALEMWRLLDPESNLINSIELLNRIVCVKSGLRKSLLNVFQDGICHPRMALVIDDRLKVWNEKDQPRVHVVPAFAPYYAPQAEANNAVPVLCVARNVACNVRGGFFKEFDEGLLQKILDVRYEDDMTDIPSAPDVSNYLISEDDASASNGNKDPLCFEGMSDVEVERRLKDAIQASSLDPRLAPSQHAVTSSSVSISQPISQGPISLTNKQFAQAASLVHVGLSESTLQSSPAREEGEVPESELDPDTRRRLLILQHGQDTRDHTSSEPAFPIRPSLQVSVPPVQSRGSWFPLEEEMSPRQLNRAVPKEFSLESEAMHFDKRRSHHPSFIHGVEGSISSDRTLNENQRLPKEGHNGDEKLRLNRSVSSFQSLLGEEVPLGRSPSAKRDLHFDSGRGTPPYSESPAVALQEIATKCGSKVEFRPALVASTELQFSIEVWFTGEKIGEGIGKTRKEAQQQAAESSLRNLANKYLSHVKPDPSLVHGDLNKLPHTNENGFVDDTNSSGYLPFSKEESIAFSTTSEPSRILDPRTDGSKKSMGSVAALKELCVMEGFNLVFQPQPPLSISSMQKGEAYAQVEIGGQVFGKGIGSTWDEAKLQAAEEALTSLKSMLGQYTQKRPGSPRSSQSTPSKRLKPELSRVLQRIPSARYAKNTPPVP
ncbi:RNA polymerase II C-terminal domain phosphatase-like 1 [Telopea speciosissima]|uniref:RNA polymerase II C-terminal domain phosphatase-like 1 n=1 Tax=Telopea speciosissima TaxID=54955 RepID=UPI001CC662AD|nr:RNA polymerase II C-terminal domain phosphatase-like 1 [Telopea speciosissima]XP_043688257.1 RNA polymerase II C-terminal domain phosphatase-like 1 [Telopea speciosissima]